MFCVLDARPEAAEFIARPARFWSYCGSVFPHYFLILPLGMVMFTLQHCILEVYSFLFYKDLRICVSLESQKKAEFLNNIRTCETMGTLVIALNIFLHYEMAMGLQGSRMEQYTESEINSIGSHFYCLFLVRLQYFGKYVEVLEVCGTLRRQKKPAGRLQVSRTGL